MRDPIELFEYPPEWIKNRVKEEGRREVEQKIESGLFILTPDGWLRRGITTGTTASAAICGAIASIYEDVESVSIRTPVGITVEVDVSALNGVATARKFAGDHEFDITDRLQMIAEVVDGKGIEFGEGTGIWKRGKLKGQKAVSRTARKQIDENFRIYAEKYGFEKGIYLKIPNGKAVAQKTDNPRIGVKGGISILGTTGFVEPWSKRLVEVKAEIASRYDRIVITTGRKGWKWALNHLKGYQPFVFGVHIDHALKAAKGDVIIAGLPSLLIKWAVPELKGKLLRDIGTDRLEKFRKKILDKARSINENVVDVFLIGGKDD
jgi:cobalt-precorrin-5B (C1)-methyltransferase